MIDLRRTTREMYDYNRLSQVILSVSHASTLPPTESLPRNASAFVSTLFRPTRDVAGTKVVEE